MEKGLEILQEVKDTYGLPILTDVHESWQCAAVAEVADVLQIPAFLARQTDLLVAAAKTGKVVNVKKGQFMAPWDMRGAIAKIEANHPLASKNIWLTERGSSFGYGNIVVDMTALVKMREYGYPVVFDATHAVQQPSSQAGVTGGNREMVPHLMRAALAVGIDGLFLEVHPDPDHAISDAANQVRLNDIENILKQAIAIDNLHKQLTGV
jgi:2-dehydro-3-deoxyphosphooctonate aldolase (KDO 8-P synthase)